MAKKRKAFSDEIRAAIDDCGMTRYQICKELNLVESAMSRFMNRQGGLSLKTLDRLAELLGLHITIEMKPKRKKAKG